MISRIQSFFVLSIAYFLFSCSDSVKSITPNSIDENTIRGKVLMLDKNSSVVEVELLARSENLVGKIPSKIGSKISLILQPGDVSLLEKKEFFRGELQESFSPALGKTFLLHNVWPDDPAQRIMFNNVNRLLRERYTFIRGINDTNNRRYSAAIRSI